MIRTAKPCIKFENQVSDWVQPPLILNFSGELKTSKDTQPMGMARFSSRISGVAISGRMGKDDAADILSVAAQVYINGVAALDTTPTIAYVSGEAAQYKTTQGYVEDNTAAGVTVAVIGTACEADAGDIISCALTTVRTATPTTEIAHVSVMVEMTPVLP